MKRKKFVKQLQGIGIQRNVGDWIARDLVPGNYGAFMCGFLADGDTRDRALVNVATTSKYFKIKVSKRHARQIAEEQLQKFGLDLSDVDISAEHRVSRGGGGHD